MELTWHGHSTWHVVVDDTELLIDPYFDNPKTDVDPEELDPDYLLLTHGSPITSATWTATRGASGGRHPELTGYIQENFGHENAVGGMGMNIGGTVECGDAWVTMVRADHSNRIDTGYGTSAGMPAGFVIGDKKPTQESDPDCTTFYHAGDTGLMMSEMVDVIAPYLEPDAAPRCRRATTSRWGRPGPASPPTGWAPTWCSRCTTTRSSRSRSTRASSSTR